MKSHPILLTIHTEFYHYNLLRRRQKGSSRCVYYYRSFSTQKWLLLKLEDSLLLSGSLSRGLRSCFRRWVKMGGCGGGEGHRGRRGRGGRQSRGGRRRCGGRRGVDQGPVDAETRVQQQAVNQGQSPQAPWKAICDPYCYSILFLYDYLLTAKILHEERFELHSRYA